MGVVSVNLILASRSPRRAELLRRLGLRFEIRPTAVAEELSEFDSATAAVEGLARRKASAAAEPGALSIGSDTVVVQGGDALVKPETRAEALEMIARLAGGEHLVHTGIALATPTRVESAVETTRVWFRSLDPSEREEYVATGESMDKAGAYGIQSYGAALVERIEGDYFNVMGLPIQRLLQLFRRFGYRYAFAEELVELAGS